MSISTLTPKPLHDRPDTAEAGGPAQGGSPVAILIVEDHPVVRAALRDWLSVVFPDCLCLEAVNGEEAVPLALARSPAIVLMDIGMGPMNGIEATRRIKAAAPQTQVVMLSIHEANSYQTAALAAGASAYVTKRMMQADLLPVMRRLLTRPVEGPTA